MTEALSAMKTGFGWNGTHRRSRIRSGIYEKRDKGYVSEKTEDLQKIDVGIALCHFVMGLEEQGKEPKVIVADPRLAIPDSVEYIATVQNQ